MPKMVFVFVLGLPITFALVFWAALAISHSGEDDQRSVGATAEAALFSPDGTAMGTVTLTEGPNGVVLATEVHGLAPGGHALTLNALGACDPNFEAAGGEFAPHGGEHGFLLGDGPHVGDLPNLYVGRDGIARADFFAVDITLGTGEDHSVFDDDGSTIIVHERPDNYAGGSNLGSRIACGVIQRN